MVFTFFQILASNPWQISSQFFHQFEVELFFEIHPEFIFPLFLNLFQRNLWGFYLLQLGDFRIHITRIHHLENKTSIRMEVFGSPQIFLFVEINSCILEHCDQSEFLFGCFEAWDLFNRKIINWICCAVVPEASPDLEVGIGSILE